MNIARSMALFIRKAGPLCAGLLFSVWAGCNGVNARQSALSCPMGFYDLDAHPENGCEYACQFVSSADPIQKQAPYLDENCDGVDGIASQSVFVDQKTGDDLEMGTQDHPVKTIFMGLALAKATGRNAILISKGIYIENLTLSSGISLYGGYDRATSWNRSDENGVLIKGQTNGADKNEAAIIAIQGNHIEQPTTLSFLTVHAAQGTEHGQSSYGIHCISCPSLTLHRMTIVAGSGADGTPTEESPNPLPDAACPNVVEGKSPDGAGGNEWWVVEDMLVSSPGNPGNAGLEDKNNTMGGSPGNGGEGGGNSIALFVKNANGLTIEKSHFISGNGGNGAAGEMGQSPTTTACPAPFVRGGDGGGGAGGLSFCIYSIDSNIYIDGESIFMPGSGGKGGRSPSMLAYAQGATGANGALHDETKQGPPQPAP